MTGPDASQDGPDDRRLLFSYGTLAPREPEAIRLGGWEADAVRGRLFDLGPYPALVDLDDPEAGWVEGYVRPVDEAELRERLDPYEGVAAGLYRRSTATTRAGRLVWVYTYARPIPRSARGPFPRWAGLRGALGSGTAGQELDHGQPDRPGQ